MRCFCSRVLEFFLNNFSDKYHLTLTPSKVFHRQNVFLCFVQNRQTDRQTTMKRTTTQLRLVLFTLLACATCLWSSTNVQVQAQTTDGFASNAYSGVTGADLNPANILGTIYKVDVTLAGANPYFHNNYLSFAGRPWKWNFNDGGYTESNTNGTLTNATLQARLHLPSVMVDIDNNSAMAFSLQTRFGVNADNVGAELSKMILEEAEYTPYQDPATPYTSPGLNLRSMSWTEIGLSYGRLILLTGPQGVNNKSADHRIKVAARLKYLMGHQGFQLKAKNDVQHDFTSEELLNIYNADFEYGHSSDYNVTGFSPAGSGFGFDLGAKYSYMNKIIVGASLLDFGSIKFDKQNDVGDFSIDVRDWNLNNLEIDNIDALDDTLRTRGTFNLNDERSFSLRTPMALSFQFTYYLWDSGPFEGGGYHNVYFALNTYTALKSDDGINAISRYTLTPGFNLFSMNVGFPLTYNEFNEFHAGAFMRLGPFIMGSNNFLTNLASKEVNTVDAYLLLKIPIIKPVPIITYDCAKRF